MINGIIHLYDATPGGIWDDFEINGVRNVGHLAVEACPDNEAEYWSAYIHFVGGTVQCIGDFNTREDAEKFVKFMQSLILLKTGGTIANKDIAAMIPTLSTRPDHYYDLIRLLLNEWLQYDEHTAS